MSIELWFMTAMRTVPLGPARSQAEASGVVTAFITNPAVRAGACALSCAAFTLSTGLATLDEARPASASAPAPAPRAHARVAPAWVPTRSTHAEPRPRPAPAATPTAPAPAPTQAPATAAATPRPAEPREQHETDPNKQRLADPHWRNHVLPKIAAKMGISEAAVIARLRTNIRSRHPRSPRATTGRPLQPRATPTPAVTPTPSPTPTPSAKP